MSQNQHIGGAAEHSMYEDPYHMQSGLVATTQHGPGSPTEIRDDRELVDVALGLPCRLEGQALEWMLSSSDRIRRIHLSETMEELSDFVACEAPRIVLLDDRFYGSDLLGLSRQLPIRLKQTLICMFADQLSGRQLQVAANHCTGLLSRHCSAHQLIDQLESVNHGNVVVAPQFSSRVIIDRNGQFRVQMAEKAAQLTDRQLEVLIRVANGKSAKDIGQELHITEKAVESHKYRLMKTLNVSNRLELCRWAIREGLIQV